MDCGLLFILTINAVKGENEMSWNYRVVKSEVYYEDGKVDGWTEDAIAPGGETVDELREELQRMISCLDKPVLDEAELEDTEKECDALRQQLDVAKKAMKRIPHNVNHCKHGACHGCEMDEALAEIEKIGKESGTNHTIDDEDGKDNK
jgi:hypothetical protein